MPETTPPFGILRLPAQVCFGVGVLASLTEVTLNLGRRVFICADPFIVTTEAFRGAHNRLLQAGLDVSVFTGLAPELPVASVGVAAAAAVAFEPDVIIGFGGGTVLDGAKLTALLVTYPGPLSAFYGENNVPGAVIPVVAVPTTSGTGSEVTPVAVVSDPDRELKIGISSAHLIPRYAIVDPQLSVGAPAAVTAHSGIDALVHAIESFTSAQRQLNWSEELPVFVGRNSLSSLVGLEAIRAIGSSLRTAVSTPDELVAREGMSYGSLLAGMAFGAGGTHLAHALQYPIGALTKTPHGLGTGLMLPYVMQACLPQSSDELATIGSALGATGGSSQERAREAIVAVRSLVADIGIPRTLAEIGVERAQLPRICELALTVTRLIDNAPIEVTTETLGRVLEAAWSGSLDDLPQ